MCRARTPAVPPRAAIIENSVDIRKVHRLNKQFGNWAIRNVCMSIVCGMRSICVCFDCSSRRSSRDRNDLFHDWVHCSLCVCVFFFSRLFRRVTAREKEVHPCVFCSTPLRSARWQRGDCLFCAHTPWTCVGAVDYTTVRERRAVQELAGCWCVDLVCHWDTIFESHVHMVRGNISDACYHRGSTFRLRYVLNDLNPKIVERAIFSRNMLMLLVPRP